jgi:SM-20-related protein
MNITEISEQLEHTGYAIVDKPLQPELMSRLLARCQNDDPARFHAAHIGRGADKKQISSIRGDVIDWLDEHNPVDQEYLACMEKLRKELNEALYLGLFDYECHYAIYSAGAGYAKHSDVLNGKKNRVLTTVLYLNEDWKGEDGGELVLFNPSSDRVIATIVPKFGTMAIFLSESFPHEVLISRKTRRSITGWFRVSGS